MSLGKHLLDNLEIYLTFAGLAVIFLVASILSHRNYWQVIGLTAIAVGIVHGVLFWVIRRRQRLLRDELINVIRPMLADRIKNPLTVVLAAATEPGIAVKRESVAMALEAAHEISRTLDRLSMESLRRWQAEGRPRGSARLGNNKVG